MADEATVQTMLTIQKGNLDYRSNPISFRATVSGTKGPTPGAIAVSVDGTNIDLSQLTTPGLCLIHNLDSTNFVEVGRWDQTTSRFYPLMKILAGEFYVIRLSPRVEDEYEGTGTGTAVNVSKLRIKANTAPCVVVVSCFEA